MTIAAMRRTRGIDDILTGYQPQEVREQRALPTDISNKFDALFMLYKVFLDYENPNDQLAYIRNVTTVLDPADINLFLQATMSYEEREHYGTTGYFISKLIQNSYDAGHNNFYFESDVLTNIHSLGYNLHGEKERLLKVTIKGDIGCAYAEGAHYVDFRVHGSEVMEEGGYAAEDCTFRIGGNAGDLFVGAATHCDITIEGTIGEGCGGYNREISAFDQRFIEDSTFKSTNRETIEKLARSNTISFSNASSSSTTISS